MQIYLLLTENCNLKCSMCIRGKQDGVNLDFNKLKGFNWIDEFKNHDIVLTGGEPTLHPEFINIVEYMCEHSKTVTITSNGTSDYYINSGFMKDNLYFQISLDGDEYMHDSIRGTGTFKKTFNTLKKLDEVGAKYSVATVVSRKNKGLILRLEKKLHELNKMRYWRISYEMPFGNAASNTMMSAQEWNEFVDYMLDNVNLKMKIKKIFPFDLYKQRKKDLDKFVEKTRCFNCGSGRNKIYIYPDFQVYSCTCLTDFPLGNLRSECFSEILNGDKIKKFSEYKIENAICNSCEYKKYCNGGCIGMSYHYFGRLGMGDIRCPKFGEK